MTVFQQVLFVISISSTIILVIQTILALIGLAGNNDAEFGESYVSDSGDIDIADGDADIDTDFDAHIESVDSGGDIHDGEYDHGRGNNFDANGLRLFTVRGIMAFLTIGSWVGFLLSKAGINEFIATAFAFVSGMATLVLMAKFMQVMMRLQSDGTLKIKNALGQIGQVYIRIPGEEKGKGKVSVTVQERLCEFEAVTEKEETIKTGEMVYVTDIRAGNVLVVEKVEEN